MASLISFLVRARHTFLVKKLVKQKLLLKKKPYHLYQNMNMVNNLIFARIQDTKFELVKANINNKKEIDECVNYILSKEYSIEILINNAGIGFT